MKRALSIFSLLMATLGAFAENASVEVHVYRQTLAGGVETQLADEILSTGGDYTTSAAPNLSGYIFTEWTISRNQPFVNRDRLGRAKDVVTYHLYESMTLTANYLPEAQDEDGDGVADGAEIYWYGSTAADPKSDTDNDGMTFAEELAAGTNPLIPNEAIAGGIIWDNGSLEQYNPTGLMAYVIRSEPEGELFATMSDFVEQGTSVSTPKGDRAASNFAYWTCNGVRVQDRRGRAVDQVTFAMPSESVEYVAHCIGDAELREQYYWYGRETAMSSDTDGDGMTLAEEIAAGTNPLFPNESIEGGFIWDNGELLLYNPDTYKTYVIRCEPEGELFATISDTAKVGTTITSPVCDHTSTSFAYWTLNGLRQQDRRGRALDQVTFVMPGEEVELVAVCLEDDSVREQYYWYGAETAMSSDSDGDGMTLEEELAAGTNPLIANESIGGGIIWDNGEAVESDLQPYEQVKGAVVGEKYETWIDVGGSVKPVVADVTGDGLWDLVVVSEGATNVYANVGSKGSPRFEKVEVKEQGEGEQWNELLEMNSTAKLAEMELDVEPIAALSATTWNDTLLVSDTDGRIWYYTSSTPTPSNYTLNHKVWGGSHAGFAEGLQLAAVDWEDDGDLDCLCGTADGRLFLLRNPKVGRPTNLIALAGVDNVLLLWDPVPQSRVRGYKVYRDGNCLEPPVKALGGTEGSITSALPMYRDSALAPGDYAYEVTSLSRFYTAGNSEPMVVESVPSESVRAHIEDAELSIHEPFDTEKGTVEVIVSINNSVNYDAVGRVLTIDYTSDLEYLGVLKSDLSLDLRYTLVEREGQVELTITEGELLPGSGTVFTIVFRRIVTVGPTILKGDVDGNGVVDKEDLKLLARLKDSVNRKWTDEQLNAGDLNGNGRLDNGDYQALKALLKEGGK